MNTYTENGNTMKPYVTDLPWVVVLLLVKHPDLVIDSESETARCLPITGLVIYRARFETVTPAFCIAPTDTRIPKYLKSNTYGPKLETSMYIDSFCKVNIKILSFTAHVQDNMISQLGLKTWSTIDCLIRLKSRLIEE